MQWIETIVHTTTAGSDLVSEILISCGALGTQVIDRRDVAVANHEKNAWDIFDKNLAQKMPMDVLVKGWFSNEDRKNLNTIEQQLADLKTRSDGIRMGTLVVEINAVADDDWAESWKRYYKPFRIGDRLVIKPSWEPYQPAGNDVVIEIDPGMAFGTGTHETTNMCLMLLEEYVDEGMQVMDIGTGSGILAVAAAKLGAEEVLALDIDPDAVKVALENVQRNGVEKRVRVAKGDMVRNDTIECDLAVANIVAGAINVLAEPIKKYLRKGGYFLCSGITKEHEQDVLDSLAEAGYAVVTRMEQGEWVALCARRMK